MTTITHSAGVVTPRLIDGYQARRETRTVVHDVLDRTAPDVTLRAPGPRVGSLRCLFPVQADAIAAFDVLGRREVFVLADADVPTVDMSFVVSGGDLGIELDDETRDLWWLVVPFVEVSP